MTVINNERGIVMSRLNVNRDSYFDNLKGALILLVVIGHFLLPMEQTRLVWCIFYLIYLFHMPMFVLISGYFSKGIYQDGKFRTERLLRILWLYILFKLAVHVTESLVEGTPILGPIDFFTESGAPWYLLAVMWWYLSIPLIAGLKPGWVMLAAVTVGLFSGYLSFLGNELALSRTLSFAPFFYGGYYLSRKQVRRFVESRWKWGFVALAAVLALTIALGNKGVFGIYQYIVYGMNYQGLHERVAAWGGLIRAVQYGFALIMILALMAVMPVKKTILTGIGERSLQIYILHRLLRDMMQYWGFYEVFTSQYRRTVFGVIALAVMVTYVLGVPCIGPVFQKLQRVPDWCLARLHRNV